MYWPRKISTTSPNTPKLPAYDELIHGPGDVTVSRVSEIILPCSVWLYALSHTYKVKMDQDRENIAEIIAEGKPCHEGTWW